MQELFGNMSQPRDLSGYESDPEPGFSVVEAPHLEVANIARTTNDFIGGWTKHMVERCGMVKPDNCCILDPEVDYYPCPEAVTAAAHMAF